jgi:hypothetical protein
MAQRRTERPLKFFCTKYMKIDKCERRREVAWVLGSLHLDGMPERRYIHRCMTQGVVTLSIAHHHRLLVVSFTGHWNLDPRIPWTGPFLIDSPVKVKSDRKDSPKHWAGKYEQTNR